MSNWFEMQDVESDSVGFLMRAAKPRDEALFPLPGQTLCNGRFRVGRKIGSGGMGAVYAAWDEGKPVALKTLRHCAPLDIYRLKSEFRRLSGLVHPHLVMVHQLIVEDGFWFFTMELVNGKPLNRYWNELPHKSTGILKCLVRQLIEGICAIHRAGLLHRDVKPSNVMVEPSGRVVILDFGLVSDQEPGGEGQTIPGQLCGTPAYMAPEYILGQAPTEANDWYATGVVLYELLTGTCPFQGSPAQILEQKRREGFCMPLHTPYGDPELLRLCEVLLRPTPSHRPQSQRLLAQVQTWKVLGTQPVSATPPSNSKREAFVGRTAHLQQLDAAYQRALSGQPTLVWVSGPSGIGKSRLLRCFAERLSELDAPVVLRGQCLECETVPHNAFDSVIDHFSRVACQLPEADVAQLVPRHVAYLARLFPVLLRIGAIESSIHSMGTNVATADVLIQHRRAVSSLKDLFHRLAERRRLVVFLDDMQWSDQDSINLLRELTQPPDPPPMLIVAASRSAVSADTFGPDVTVSLELAPLSDEETLDLASTLLPFTIGDRDGCLRTVVQQSEGLPIYAIEMARALAMPAERSEVRSLSWLFQQRIRTLPEDALEVLGLLAAAARPMVLAFVEEILGRSVARSIRTARHELLVSSEIVDGKEHVRLAHDHVRQAMLEVLSPEARRQAHSKLADALLTRNEPEWLVSQLLFSERLEEAALHATAAGNCAAQRLAFDNAAEFFALALQGKNLTAEREYELRISCAEALACSGQCDVAARQFLLAAQLLGPGNSAVSLRAKAATQWLRAGFVAEGVSELRRVLHEFGISWPQSTLSAVAGFVWQRTRIRLLRSWSSADVSRSRFEAIDAKLEALTPASTVLGVYDYVRGAYFSALALPMALRSGHPRYVLAALASEAVYRVMMDGSVGSQVAQRLLKRVAALDMPPQDETYRRGAEGLIQAMVAYWSGNWNAVDAPSKSAEVLFEACPGSSWEVALLRSIRHTARLQTEPAEIESELPSLIREARRHNDRYAGADLCRTRVMTTLALHGSSDAMAALTNLETELARAPLVSLQHLIMATRVQLMLASGRVADAATILDSEWRSCAAIGMDRFPLVRCAVIGMRADILEANGSLGLATRRDELRELAKRAARQPTAFARALACSIAASADKLDGNLRDARAHAQSASASYHAAGMELSAIAELIECGDETEPSLEFKRRGVKDPMAWRTRRRCLF